MNAIASVRYATPQYNCDSFATHFFLFLGICKEMSGDHIRVIAIIVAAAVLAALVYYYYMKNVQTESKAAAEYTAGQRAKESFQSGGARYTEDDSRLSQVSRVAPSSSCDAGARGCEFDPMPLEPASNEYYLPPPRTTQSSSYFSANPNQGSDFPQERLKPEDLLPRNAANTKWAQANPAGQGDVNNVNLLNAGFHIGVDTQGQSLRNASHDLRSEPSNPRYKVSIWNNSTIEPDMNRKPLE